MKMAMENNLSSTHKASNYKQVNLPNGKYGHLSLQSGINKCDICGKNFPKKLFDHIRKCHYQYFCTVCRARFKVHKDLICHVKDVHHLLASENLDKDQDEFSNEMNRRYFAEPLTVSQPPISPSIISQSSNSSSDYEEILLDNPDVLDIIIGTKNSKEHKEETEITNIVNDIVIEVLEDFKAKELFESTLQDLSCSDGSVTDESDYKTVNKLRSSEDDPYSYYSNTQNNYDNFLSNNVCVSENNEINDKMCTSHKYPSNENLQPSQTVHIVDEEFKLGIKNMNTVLSEKSPWLNGPDTMQNMNSSAKSENDLLVMALTLDHKLADMKLNVILKECIRTSCLTCVYCHNSTCIAVNGKQLALHMIEKHRFMTVKNESSEDVANILKSNLNILENVYLNSENFDSTDELSHTSFNNTFYCFNCQYTSTQMKEVNSHKRSIHSRKTYECIMCKITFSNYSELHCHLCPGTELGVWQNVLFRCLFCGQSQIPSAFRCMVHLRKAHNACDYCLETFPNQQSLAIHVNKHKMRHMCLKCNITYLNKKDIFEHMFWKHNRDSKECKLCLTKKWPYTYHFCVPPTMFACDDCKRTFSNALLLRVHERWHTGNIPYECSTCHSKFISKKLLKKHEIIHNELISPTKKKKKKKKKKGDDYNLPPLNLSSDSDTEKTPRNKPEKYLKSPSPSGNNYWDYVSKQKKELVNIALLDHDYTLLSTIQPAIKSPQYPDELTANVNDSQNLLNNSFNNSLCQRSSCSSHCNSSSSLSSSCGSNCSCSSSCSSSSDSDAGEKIKTIVESPKKHKKKKKEKKIKVPSAKKIKNFNLYALESDLESEFSNTDNEEYYDINPVPLHPEVNMVSKDVLPVKQGSLIENKPVPVNMISTLMPQNSPVGQNFKLSKPLNNSYQYTNIESQSLGNNEVIGLSHNECKIPDEYEMYGNNCSSTNILSYNQESIDNNLNKNSIEVCNGNSNLHSVQNELNLSKYHSQQVEKKHYSKKNFNSSFTKRPTKSKSKFKTSKNISQFPKEITYASSPLSMNSSYLTGASDLSKASMSPNDTRQSKRQPKKRKFFGYESSDEEQIPNGDSSFVHQFPPHLPSSIKKKQKRKHKPESPIQFQPKTSKLTQSQQTRPIVDVRISKTAVPTIDKETDSDSDSGNLVIELPKFVEQKAVQSTERLYCHCRCPYDEVSEMIACDNPNCRVEWFHFDCVGITIAPKGNWYCPDCR